MPRFKNSWRRIERAISHGKSLVAEWARLFPEGKCRVVVRQERDWTCVAEAILDIPAENNLALELGEFFYQLRSALDGAVWEAVTIMEGAEPSSDINRLDFPICADKKQFEQSAIHKHVFPEELNKWLESIQPYQPEKQADHPDRGLEVTLELLHNLARKDRHRRLRVVAAVPTELKFQFAFSSPAKVVAHEGLRCNFLEGERDFLRFTIQSDDGGPIEKIVLATALKIEIAVDEIPNWNGGALSDELARFVMATQHVIQRFEKSFN